MPRRYANPHDVRLVRWLIEAGLNNCQISRSLGIPIGTIRNWRHRPGSWPGQRTISGRPAGTLCPRCHGRDLDEAAYVYLLGQYLGDGHVARMRRGVYCLRITMDARYPEMIEECRTAMATVRSSSCRPYVSKKQGCVTVGVSWKHWPCVFPQHGAGRKHERRIVLQPWQEELVDRHPQLLIRGLIQSDGWRGTNPIVRRYRTSTGATVHRYAYPRYLFTNYSIDILGIFTDACDRYGIRWRQSRWNTISVARREDVLKLDRVVGLKS